MIYMWSLEHNAVYISMPICTNRLIFRKCTFAIFFLFLDIANNPIISQI